MNILGKIFGKIFPSAHASDTPTAAGSDSAPASSPPAPIPSPAATGAAAPAAAPAMPQVDVEKTLDEMASKASEKLNWKTSIVDLMKLLGVDSSFAARRELAQELRYTGDSSDSASMNIWLHRQVMNKVAANGGKVTADLKD